MDLNVHVKMIFKFGRILSIVCYLFVAIHIVEGNPTGNAEVVYPERIHATRSRRDLSTALKDGEHEGSLTIKIATKQENVLILELRKNGPIHPGSILLRTFGKDGKPVHKRHVPDDCMYCGHIRGKPNSNVFISSCRGLTGSIDTGEKQYDIEPHGGDNGHKFYGVDDELDKITKTLSTNTDANLPNDMEEEAEVDIKDAPEGIKKGAKGVRPFQLVNVEEQYIKYLTTNDTRYVEMFVSADHILYQRYYNDTEVVMERVLNALGQVDKAYQAINVRIVLVALEIHTNGPAFNRSKNGGKEIRTFTKYWNSLKKEGPFKDIRMDNGQLFSHYHWLNGIGGMAYGGGLCKSYSIGIDMWSFNSISGPTVIIGHEFGHNMNFHHDDANCKCLTRRGCFMGGRKSSRPGFSNCSMKSLASKKFACINDYPANPLSSVCGNGITEKGEGCDCGTPENCARNDPCCEPKDCKLKAEAQCNFANGQQCCNTTCQFQKQGTLCREAFSNCDVPEYCTGENSTCPVDRTMIDGTHCGESVKMLLGPSKHYGRKTAVLAPAAIARYFKVIPKHWKNKGYACMQLEMLGCNANEDPLVGTPISSLDEGRYGAMCLTPDITSCDKPIADGTKLKYKSMPNKDCYHPHMLYTHAADGTLTHKCSGKKVCPSEKKYMMISSKCASDESTYIRTAKSSLQQKKSGLCVAAYHLWPRNGNNAKLLDVCDIYRGVKLVFQNTDCLLPLGFKNGKLPDSAFSAGPSNGLLNIRGRNYRKCWCAATKTDGSWFQIDFGKVVKVRKIVVSGNYWNWVAGYYLHYSDNGVLWNKYKESSAATWKDLNSYCYNGECAPTYDHQCQQLWNADANKASDGCWKELNMNATGYGSCEATANTSCAKSDVFCGQLQCTSPANKPYRINYGTAYKDFTVDGEKCSGAMITNSEQVGLGMVNDGTMCGRMSEGNFCVERECKNRIGHGIRQCGGSNRGMCSGRGICKSDRKCHCNSGYNPDDDCTTLLRIVDGNWNEWSSWTVCTKACGTGKQQRHRFCNNPLPKYGGTDCLGARVAEQQCNKEACLVARSCKDLKRKMENAGKPVYDGVYTIKPTASISLKVYCDMTRNGGGWTLVVSSHENLWTAENVRLRNIEHPQLYADYSILGYADKIKDTYLIKGATFEYRLEANTFGLWGGIWKAPNRYSMASNDSNLNDVTLLTKFSDWQYSKYGIGKRLPYISNQRITVGFGWRGWGCITDNTAGYLPSRWISGSLKMGNPEHVWYWLREGDYGYRTSCLEFGLAFVSGTYLIEPKPGKIVQTYCDFDRYGGGWTLLVKSSGPDGWSFSNVLDRNSNQVTANQYSIYGLVDILKGNDAGEKSFDYMIKADGNNGNGGIFSLSLSESLLRSTCSELKPTLITKFGTWDEDVENIAKYPLRLLSNGDIFLAANAGNSSDKSGVIIAGKGKSVYMASYNNPSSVKVWIRAGGSRKSCNDIKIHGYHKGKLDYQDGIYMLMDLQPVYCDMTTTDKEGWTLLVTSANKGWAMNEVMMRDMYTPSLRTDYSILRKADSIKSLSNGQYFKYMLDAQQRRHWGGIWKAPIEYSFISTSNRWTDVALLTKFGKWDYNKFWWNGPCKRMPYLGNAAKHRALLTTAKHSDYTEWGTIISENSMRNPSQWYYPAMKSPGLIWYWINENDCDGDYKEVNGGYSISSWSPCNVFCGEGVQVRTRRCNNPFPRCGGEPCDSSLKLREERSCTGACPASQMKTPDGAFCLQPENGRCSAVDGTKIVFRSSESNCTGEEAIFVFNPSNGEIIHKCSNKSVCFLSGDRGDILKIDSNCPNATNRKHFQRTQFQSIYFYEYAMAPNAYKLEDGNHIVLNGNGMDERERLIFTNRTFLHHDSRDNGDSGKKICPSSYPYVYLRGRYCCRYDRENVYSKKTVIGCDGSKIGFDSECCKDHAYSECVKPPCANYFTEYKSIGCWKDKPRRAITSLEGADKINLRGNYRTRSDAIEKCYQAAVSKGYHYFAVQHGGWCASSSSAGNTYKMYGPSKACKSNGKGGPWANEVYRIISVSGIKAKEICHLKKGDGVGGIGIKIGSRIPRKSCFAECLKLRKRYSGINGMTVYSNGTAGCWCQKYMNNWNTDKEFQSCMFVAKIEGYKYGHVNSSFFNNIRSLSKLEKDTRFPNNPTATGFIDELATPHNFGSTYAMQLKSYFMAPQTGHYVFMAACDDECKVYLSNNTDESNKEQILYVTSYTGYYQFDKYSNQKSAEIHLIVGKQYYIEATLVEITGGDHMEIGAILPGDTHLEPITYEYLSNSVQ